MGGNRIFFEWPRIEVFEIAGHGMYCVPELLCNGKAHEELERGPATMLKRDTHGWTAADIDRKLFALYEANELQPFSTMCTGVTDF